jgi:hypothetical protein
LRLHHLVHHVTGALTKRFESAALALKGWFAVPLAEFAGSAFHLALGLSKAFSRLDAHIAKALLQLAELLSESVLLSAQLLQCFLELLGCHLIGGGLALIALLLILRLALLARCHLVEKRVTALHPVFHLLVQLEGLLHQFLLVA